MPTVEYRHHITFRAVSRVKDRRTGNPVGPILGHHYRVGLVFAGNLQQLLPLPAGVEEITGTVAGFITEHWDGQDLTAQRINTTPLDLCWYLTQVLGGRVSDPGLLTAVTLTVDGEDTFIFWPDSGPIPHAPR